MSADEQLERLGRLLEDIKAIEDEHIGANFDSIELGWSKDDERWAEKRIDALWDEVDRLLDELEDEEADR